MICSTIFIVFMQREKKDIHRFSGFQSEHLSMGTKEQVSSPLSLNSSEPCCTEKSPIVWMREQNAPSASLLMTWKNELEHLSWEKKLGELGLKHQVETAWRDLINGYKYLKGRWKKDILLSPTSEVMGTMWNAEDFILDIRKYYFAVWINEGWHRLSRDVVRNSILGDAQKPSRHRWAAHYFCPCLSREIGLDNLQGSHLNQPIILWFCLSGYIFFYCRFPSSLWKISPH